jgi:hypothetical protein
VNIYVLWCRSGTRYFVRATYSFAAVAVVESRFHEKVSSWDIATSLPLNAIILDP